MYLTELISNIRVWAVDRDLHTADPDKQMLKLMEEVGELAEGLAKYKQDMVIDGIGDTFVVLTILSMQLGLSIEDCIEDAFLEISDRKGKMVNGVFVKDSDLT